MINLSNTTPRAPVRWSFEQQLELGATHELTWRTDFYRSDSAFVWRRDGYTLDDARSLVEYLNSRS